MKGQVGAQASSTISGLPRLWQTSAIALMSAQVPYGIGLTIRAPAVSGWSCHAWFTWSGEGG